MSAVKAVGSFLLMIGLLLSMWYVVIVAVCTAGSL